MSDFTPILVTQPYTYADGTPAAGQVDFLLTAPLRNSVTGARVPVAPITAPLVAGALAVILWANTDATTIPTDSAYRVIERLSGQDTRHYTVVVPATAPGGTVVLGTLPILEGA